MKSLFAALHPSTGFTAVANGAGRDVGAYDSGTQGPGILVSGTFVATIQIQVSMDGTNWAPFGAALTAPGTVKIDIPVKQVRAICSAFTSGSAQVLLGAKNSTSSDE